MVCRKEHGAINGDGDEAYGGCPGTSLLHCTALHGSNGSVGAVHCSNTAVTAAKIFEAKWRDLRGPPWSSVDRFKQIYETDRQFTRASMSQSSLHESVTAYSQRRAVNFSALLF